MREIIAWSIVGFWHPPRDDGVNYPEGPFRCVSIPSEQLMVYYWSNWWKWGIIAHGIHDLVCGISQMKTLPSDPRWGPVGQHGEDMEEVMGDICCCLLNVFREVCRTANAPASFWEPGGPVGGGWTCISQTPAERFNRPLWPYLVFLLGLIAHAIKEDGSFMKMIISSCITSVMEMWDSIHIFFTSNQGMGESCSVHGSPFLFLHPALLLGRICLKPLFSIIHTAHWVIDGRWDH